MISQPSFFDNLSLVPCWSFAFFFHGDVLGWAAIQVHKPYAVLLASSVDGRDLASRVAGRMELGLTGDCIGLEIDEEGRLVQLKPAFGGNIVAPILSKTLPNMATLRPGMQTPVAPDESLEPIIKRLSIANLGSSSVKLINRFVEQSEDGAEIEHAERIICVGKGIGGPENLGVIRELSDALDASIGATGVCIPGIARLGFMATTVPAFCIPTV